MHIDINIYDLDEAHPTIIDSGVVEMSRGECESLIDLALEIALRHKMGMDKDVFLDLLVKKRGLYIEGEI